MMNCGFHRGPEGATFLRVLYTATQTPLKQVLRPIPHGCFLLPLILRANEEAVELKIK